MKKKWTKLVIHASLKDSKLIYNAPYYLRRILSDYEDTPKVRITIEKEYSKRTERQNRALHLWFTQLAEELNDGGYDVQLVLKKKLEMDWTPELIKEALWRPAQKVILKKRSTTELKKGEDIDKVFEHLNRHLGEKFGIYVPFPHYEKGEYEKETSK